MTPTVTDVPERGRFEIDVDGRVVGFAEYRRRPGVIAFVHTEIDPVHDGAGLGTLLVTAALDTARAQGLAVLPFCPFVQGFYVGLPMPAEAFIDALVATMDRQPVPDLVRRAG